MPCAPLLRFSDCAADTRTEAGQVMSGILEIVGGASFTPSRSPNRCTKGNYSAARSSSQRVFVRVYRTSSEHFAVLYPARAIVTACRPLASINLKSCTVKQLPNCVLQVSPRSCEGMAVTFQGTESSSAAQITDWVQAFSEMKKDAGGSLRRKKVSDHRLPLPVLVESEEDDACE